SKDAESGATARRARSKDAESGATARRARSDGAESAEQGRGERSNGSESAERRRGERGATARRAKAVCLSGMEDYYHHYADPVKPVVVPMSLLHLRDKGKDGCELSVLQQHCESLTNLVALTEAQAAAVEVQTRQQHRSPVWFTSRAGRITASNVHAVVSTSVTAPAMSIVRKVCYPKKTATTAAIKWGIDHEEEARQAYVKLTATQHENLNVEKCGFIINPSFPEVGASPDGFINCTCCGKGCPGIKCDLVPEQLHHTHKYYSQVQTQIFVTGSKYCDFVVWSQKDCVVVRILPNMAFWTTLLAKAQNFFFKVSLPELVACYYTRAASTARWETKV
uniref:YqaJ viral recombinase domain-containing protein n=1 Tax=Astyanax mexicanus TaxID=7994 RepID=A0A3B1ITU5_ASTMX